MKRFAVMGILVCFLLSGCGNLYGGTYSSVTPHVQSDLPNIGREDSAADYDQLYAALSRMVEAGEEKAVIYVTEYDSEHLEEDIVRVRTQIESFHPIGAYAVDWMSIRQGLSKSQSALTVHARYIHGKSEIRDIQRADTRNDVIQKVRLAMDRFDSVLVLWVQQYEDMDLLRIVEDYAMDAPQTVMEAPAVTVEMYPNMGADRVIEIKFSYQTGRDTLRSMQEQVEPVFERARKAVQGSNNSGYRVLYDFLMKGYNHHITPSITPSYSLLRYGVGDSKAFAQVYAAMCRESDLECLVVNGTRNGVSHYWNIIREGSVYYHLDLLGGRYALYSNAELRGYVWDYSAYPICGVTMEE